MDSAVDLLPAHEKRLLMTMDEIIERALRQAGIFPPSVMDNQLRRQDRNEQGRNHREEP